jgi:hypothetical protein
MIYLIESSTEGADEAFFRKLLAHIRFLFSGLVAQA